MNDAELAELIRQDAADGIQQHVVGAVIEHKNRILLLKRPSDDFRGGTWELPSGKVEPGDRDLLAALHREVLEETSMTIGEIVRYLSAFDYTSGGGKRTRQRTWAVTVAGSANVRLSEHDDYAWVGATVDHPVSQEVYELISTHVAQSMGS